MLSGELPVAKESYEHSRALCALAPQREHTWTRLQLLVEQPRALLKL